MQAPATENRRVIRRVTASLAEIVLVEMEPGFRAERTTCPDGQFWLPVRGEQVVERSRGGGRQRPFELLYYAPREPAVRITDSPTLAYGLRTMLSKMTDEERDHSWTEPREMDWEAKRKVLKFIEVGLSDPHTLDDSIAQWVSHKPASRENTRAHWLSRVEDLLHSDPSLSLLALSRAAGVVPAYLSAEFSRTRGLTISAYRRQIMLQRALEATSRRTLNEAAIEAGFYDASHFHRACMAEMSVRPSSLRKLIWPT